MIDTKVRKRLGQFRLDVELKSEGTTCVAGRNGAGKTSLLKAIAGLLQLDEGYVRIGTLDVTALPVEKRGVVMVTPDSSLPKTDVDSHITWGAKMKGKRIGRDELSRVKSNLGIDFEGPVRNLSTGMRERVSLATAILASPRAILVDEAFSSLHQRDEFIVSYSTLAKDRGIDLLFTSQDETDGRLADHLYSMANGSVNMK